MGNESSSVEPLPYASQGNGHRQGHFTGPGPLYNSPKAPFAAQPVYDAHNGSYIPGAKPKSEGWFGRSYEDQVDEQYANLMVNMKYVLEAWKNRTLSNRETRERCDQLMFQIQSLSVVDLNRAQKHLSNMGITDQDRFLLEDTYRELRRATASLPDHTMQHVHRGPPSGGAQPWHQRTEPRERGCC